MSSRQLTLWFGAVLAACSLTGCSLTWDDVTSREFKVASLWTPAPPPLTVIEKSTDGYARAKALNKLDESSDPITRDKYLQVLHQTATTDRDPLCRQAAIRTLGRYKDPRAPKFLSEIYLSNPGLSAENNAFIRQQALTALELSTPKEMKALFIQAAKQPGGSLTGAAARDRMEILDERLAAIRALGKYPEPDATDTLVKLLETEKDTAIRACAHESLKTSTKKDFPPDGKMWREYVATGKEPNLPSKNYLANLIPSDTPPSPTPPTALSPNNDPGVFDKISNFFRPEKTNEPTPTPSPSPAPPRLLPSTLPTSTPATPATPRPSTPISSAPTSTPGVVPAGAYRNSQGELVVPTQ